MAVISYFRSVRFVKDFLVKYFTMVFMAHEKGDLLFNDGTKDIDFSRANQVEVIKKGSWDYRKLPAVIIGEVNGNVTSFLTKDFISEPDVDDTVQKYSYGGDIELTANIEVFASTLEERDNLVDISAIFLSYPAAKDYFLNQYLKLPTPPRISEGGPVYETNIDHPIYTSTITQDVIGTWRAVEDVGSRLSEIFVDITAELDLGEP